jgi:hypothetical protein
MTEGRVGIPLAFVLALSVPADAGRSIDESDVLARGSLRFLFGGEPQPAPANQETGATGHEAPIRFVQWFNCSDGRSWRRC